MVLKPLKETGSQFALVTGSGWATTWIACKDHVREINSAPGSSQPSIPMWLGDSCGQTGWKTAVGPASSLLPNTLWGNVGRVAAQFLMTMLEAGSTSISKPLLHHYWPTSTYMTTGGINGL